MTENKQAAESATDGKTIEVRRPRGRPVGQSDWLTIDELKKILSLPDRREKVGHRDYVVLLLFANTPMRKGEIVQLTVGSLINDGTKKFIFYKALKKRKARDKNGEVKIKQRPYWLKIPLATEVYEAIVRYVQSEYKRGKVPHSAPLFMTTGIRGPYEKRALTSAAIDGIVHKYVRLAGIKKRITPHSFRATFTTLRLDEHDIRSVQALGGWSSIRSVQPYARAVQERVEAAALAHVVT